MLAIPMRRALGLGVAVAAIAFGRVYVVGSAAADAETTPTPPTAPASLPGPEPTAAPTVPVRSGAAVLFSDRPRTALEPVTSSSRRPIDPEEP